MTLKLVPPPQKIDIATALRNLASQIETGEFGEPASMVWVLEVGNELHVGSTDLSTYAEHHAHFILAKAQRNLEHGE